MCRTRTQSRHRDREPNNIPPMRTRTRFLAHMLSSHSNLSNQTQCPQSFCLHTHGAAFICEIHHQFTLMSTSTDFSVGVAQRVPQHGGEGVDVPDHAPLADLDVSAWQSDLFNNVSEQPRCVCAGLLAGQPSVCHEEVLALRRESKPHTRRLLTPIGGRARAESRSNAREQSAHCGGQRMGLRLVASSKAQQMSGCAQLPLLLQHGALRERRQPHFGLASRQPDTQICLISLVQEVEIRPDGVHHEVCGCPAQAGASATELVVVFGIVARVGERGPVQWGRINEHECRGRMPTFSGARGDEVRKEPAERCADQHE
mmetsp:Transcript_4485/g.10340  ORF Transcript_4485/g.10340 Transcript_4485/m.10340 type:complete len:315 (-) Transcript_4485:683-1627(-)